MTARVRGTCFLFVIVAALCVGAPRASAVDITTADIVALTHGLLGSGNGTLDLILFTKGSGGAGNVVNPSPPGFNGDDANTELPTGNGSTDDLSFAESYVTTAGDLQAFYNLNFGVGNIDEIVLFLDLDETSGGSPFNTLALLDIILNPTTINGNPDPSGDVSSTTQNAINQTYTGGTLLANLNPEPADNIPLIVQGAGFADYAIFTHINPFDLSPSDVLLFNISMDLLSNGGESVFASGEFKGPDGLVPEPATIALLSVGLLGLAAGRRRRRTG